MDKIKILYAANNSISSKIQLERFVRAVKDKPYVLKIAAYKKSSPDINIDWTLDCLLNMFKPEHVSLENENFEIYFDQVKTFNPDLIISDLEFFTSYIAGILNTTLWQCSSSLLNFALPQNQKYNLGLFKQFYYLFHKVPLNNQRIMNMIDNSNYNFVCSHFGDSNNELSIKDNFQWIRPYHYVGKKSVICQHNLVGGLLQANKNIVNLLRKHKDSVLFSDDFSEQYPDILLKEIKNHVEYTCNLYNSNLFVCGGQTNLIADAYYNGKFSLILPDYNDIECIINSVASEKFGFSKIIHDHNEDISSYMEHDLSPNYNSEIKLLDERIDEI